MSLVFYCSSTLINSPHDIIDKLAAHVLVHPCTRKFRILLCDLGAALLVGEIVRAAVEVLAEMTAADELSAAHTLAFRYDSESLGLPGAKALIGHTVHAGVKLFVQNVLIVRYFYIGKFHLHRRASCSESCPENSR